MCVSIVTKNFMNNTQTKFTHLFGLISTSLTLSYRAQPIFMHEFPLQWSTKYYYYYSNCNFVLSCMNQLFFILVVVCLDICWLEIIVCPPFHLTLHHWLLPKIKIHVFTIFTWIPTVELKQYANTPSVKNILTKLAVLIDFFLTD